jgi:hypothetical protein
LNAAAFFAAPRHAETKAERNEALCRLTFFHNASFPAIISNHAFSSAFIF